MADRDNSNLTRVGRVPSPGAVRTDPLPPSGGHSPVSPSAASGEAAYNVTTHLPVGRVPSPGGLLPSAGDPAPSSSQSPPPPSEPPRRLRRLHRIWPDRDGNISYLLTLCVDGRGHVLDNEDTFHRLTAFLLDSPARYDWFPRRFVLMPDHVHIIARQGHQAVRLGQWIKAFKAVVGGLEPRDEQAAGTRPVRAPGLQPVAPVGRLPSAGAQPSASPSAASGDAAYNVTNRPSVGRVPSPGVPTPSPRVPTPSPRATMPQAGVEMPSPGESRPHQFTRLKRAWRWQTSFHDHKFRTAESEQRKWGYVCLNPVRAKLVERPEQWPFGGEIFYNEAAHAVLVEGTPPLLERGLLVEVDEQTPAGGSRPTS